MCTKITRVYITTAAVWCVPFCLDCSVPSVYSINYTNAKKEKNRPETAGGAIPAQVTYTLCTTYTTRHPVSRQEIAPPVRLTPSSTCNSSSVEPRQIPTHKKVTSMMLTTLVFAGLVLASTLSAAPRTKGVDVAVIGGGPCGLATALAVQRASPNAGVSA